tara:strand:- start:113 stop:316 length:204 start_codon:yes stop_codon:yes gene_type:complete
MPKFKIKVLEGITTGTLTKTATVEAKSRAEAHQMLMDDGNVGPMLDWHEDYDVEFDSTPEYYIRRTV